LFRLSIAPLERFDFWLMACNLTVIAVESAKMNWKRAMAYARTAGAIQAEAWEATAVTAASMPINAQLPPALV
jgi:hypothetical protein